MNPGFLNMGQPVKNRWLTIHIARRWVLRWKMREQQSVANCLPPSEWIQKKIKTCFEKSYSVIMSIRRFFFFLELIMDVARDWHICWSLLKTAHAQSRSGIWLVSNMEAKGNKYFKISFTLIFLSNSAHLENQRKTMFCFVFAHVLQNIFSHSY